MEDVTINGVTYEYYGYKEYENYSGNNTQFPLYVNDNKVYWLDGNGDMQPFTVGELNYNLSVPITPEKVPTTPVYIDLNTETPTPCPTPTPSYNFTLPSTYTPVNKPNYLGTDPNLLMNVSNPEQATVTDLYNYNNSGNTTFIYGKDGVVLRNDNASVPVNITLPPGPLNNTYLNNPVLESGSNPLAYNELSNLTPNQLKQLIENHGIIPYTNEENERLYNLYLSCSPSERESLQTKANSTETPTPTNTDPYASFDYTMACNADDIKTKLSTIMEKTAKDIEEIIDDIYTKIHGMPSAGAWDGESYNAFKDSVDGYKKNLDELVVIMKGFKIVFDTASEDAKQLGADIDTQLSNFS